MLLVEVRLEDVDSALDCDEAEDVSSLEYLAGESTLHALLRNVLTFTGVAGVAAFFLFLDFLLFFLLPFFAACSHGPSDEGS